MTPSSRLFSIVSARLGQRLQWLQAWLDRWLPRQTPAMVPIPIRVDRRPADPIGQRVRRQQGWHR